MGVMTSVSISDIKALSGYNSVRVALADALLLPLSVLLPAPPHTTQSCDTLLEMLHRCMRSLEVKMIRLTWCQS